MSAYARWSRRDLVALLVGAGIVLGGLGYMGSQTKKPPSFTDGLTAARGVNDAEFTRRVMSAFPLGSRAGGLVDELKRQGFTSPDWLSSQDVQRMALRRETDRACEPTARILWRVGPEGRLTEISATYREEGCR